MLPLGVRAQCPADDAANAVLITLGDPDNDGIWTPFDGSGNPITISGDNSGCSDNYNTGAPHNARRGRPGKDVFYRIVLPACFDSLEVSLCGGATWDTYLHVINATRQDTIDGDDNCGNSRSRIIAIGRPNTGVYNPNVQANPVRDSMLLVQGDEIYIVLEGWGATNAGPYTIEVKAYRQRPVSLGAPVISGQSSVCAGATGVTLDAPYLGGYEWRWYENGTLVATTPTFSYTIPGPINTSLSYTVEVDVLDPNGEAPPTCPLLGTTPLSASFDINIAGVPADAQEITSSPTALWGENIIIDADPNDPNVGGTISLEYSTDGGATWTPVGNFSGLPHTFTLPPLASGGPYTATYEFRTVANALGCIPSVAYSQVLTVTVSDRPGNRPDNAILITLTPDPANPGHWIAPVISDSTNGPSLSNEYVDPTPGPGNVPRGRPTRDLFFKIDLPECLDSLDVSLCSSTPGLLNDTYLHLINATAQDTIDSDDGCPSGGGNLRSEIRALGLPNVLGHNPTPNVNAKPARDTLLLVNTHTLYVVVEGYSGDGKFELQVRGYKIRPSSITVSGAPSGAVCINSGSITLDATTPGATAYQWLDNNNNPIPGATSATFTVNPTSEGNITVKAVAIFNPNEDPSCPTAADSVASAPVTVTVEDTARAQIADASNTVVSGQTLTFTAGDNVTLNVSSPQTSGNSYTWNLYNSIPPSGSPTTSMGNSLTINNIAAGSYTVILEAVRGTGACGPTGDTVYLSVTTGLRTEGGTFSIFPNPNMGAFTIVAPAMDTYRVQVLDVAGRLVAGDAFIGSTHQMRLTLPAGVYQIRLLAGDKVQVGRLIITE